MSAVYVNIFASKLRQQGFFVPMNDKHNAVAVYGNVVVCIRSSNKEVKIPDTLQVPVVTVRFKVKDNKVYLYFDSGEEKCFDSIESAAKEILLHCLRLMNETDKSE